jgi:hypothetical protein
MIFSSMSLHSNSNYFCNQLGLGFMVFTATFNNIPAISGRSILLVEETGVPGENHRHVQVTDKLYHKMLYRVNVIG